MSAPILKAEADGMLDRLLSVFNNDTPPRYVTEAERMGGA